MNLEIYPGEILGVVGESGAGKSMTGNAIIGLLDHPAHVSAGEIWLDGKRVDNVSEKQRSEMRGKIVGAIFQDPLTSLNPLFTVGEQLVETIVTHRSLSEKRSSRGSNRAFKEDGDSGGGKRIDDYPHQFSGA